MHTESECTHLCKSELGLNFFTEFIKCTAPHICNLTTSTCNNVTGSYKCDCHHGFNHNGGSERICEGLCLVFYCSLFEVGVETQLRCHHPKICFFCVCVNVDGPFGRREEKKVSFQIGSMHH